MCSFRYSPILEKSITRFSTTEERRDYSEICYRNRTTAKGETLAYLRIESISIQVRVLDLLFPISDGNHSILKMDCQFPFEYSWGSEMNLVVCSVGGKSSLILLKK